MTVEVLQFIYALWAGVSLLLWLHALSHIIFSCKMNLLEKLAKAASYSAFAVAWPLAVFSPEGRKTLWTHLKEL